MGHGVATCQGCGLTTTRRNGRDRRGRQIHQCRGCRRRFTALTGTPFSGDRFLPDLIALAVRWYLRYRLSYADVAELLAERGVRVDPSTEYDRVREFAPLYEGAAHPFRHAVGSSWSVDETDTTVAGKPVYVYRAIDGRGQVVDVYVSARRAATDAAAFFRRAVGATGVVPDAVTTDGAAAYPPALAAVLPGVLHEPGKAVQQRIERDHQPSRGGCARHAGSRRSPGRGCCAPGTPSCATCGAATTTSGDRSTPWPCRSPRWCRRGPS